jgi:hypothetical protein
MVVGEIKSLSDRAEKVLRGPQQRPTRAGRRHAATCLAHPARAAFTFTPTAVASNNQNGVPATHPLVTRHLLPQPPSRCRCIREIAGDAITMRRGSESRGCNRGICPFLGGLLACRAREGTQLSGRADKP